MPQATAPKNMAPLATWTRVSQRERFSSVWSMASTGQAVLPTS
jgi:hypothetical protein